MLEQHDQEEQEQDTAHGARDLQALFKMRQLMTQIKASQHQAASP